MTPSDNEQSSISDKIMTRTEKLQHDYPRKSIFDVPSEGCGEAFVRQHLEMAMSRIPANYHSGEETAKPGTVNDPLGMAMYQYAMETANPNNVDSHMFLGSYELEQEAIGMTANLLRCPLPPTDDQIGESVTKERKTYGGWFLSGGTEAIIQATWIYRNKYFYERFAQIKPPAEFLKTKQWLLRDLLSVRARGWIGLVKEFAAMLDRRGHIPTVKIVAPINLHFALIKAADILGFGQENIARYYLKKDGTPDADSLKETCEKIVKDGDEIAMIWAVAGDTTRGALANVQELVDAAKQGLAGRAEWMIDETEIGGYGDNFDPEHAPFRIPFLVDAAAQYLFAIAMRNNPAYTDHEGKQLFIPSWDFDDVKAVRAIICDPHKNQIPYPASILILRDRSDAKYTITDEDYLSIKDMKRVGDLSSEQMEFAQTHATIPTSRAGYGAAATWAYYVGHGMIEIKRRKEKVWEMVKRFRDGIEASGIYEIVCEPQTAVVPFRLSQVWIAKNERGLADRLRSELKKKEHEYHFIGPKELELLNYIVYEGINECPGDFFYIAHSFELTARTRKENEDRKNTKEQRKRDKEEALETDDEAKQKVVKEWKTEEHFHSGLIAHFMEHHEAKTVDRLVERLEEEAKRLLET
ncbi:Aspartate 1-decarboxylase [Anaerolineae bacterium]|nr:Aspartate 1-decarboxylase [Anaerolineae bacterium]